MSCISEMVLRAMKSITIKDVARIAKVGVATVSRAINDHPDLRAETKRRYSKSLRGLDIGHIAGLGSLYDTLPR